MTRFCRAAALYTLNVLIVVGPDLASNSQALAQGSGRSYNVKEFGAKGDGVADDTAAIQNVINAAANGSTIQFPSGTYVVANLAINRREKLSFVGEGRASVIKQKSGAPRIATFDGSSDIAIRKLGFDANGVVSYGGLVFYAARRVRIEENWFWDSAPKPVTGTDRYSVVFGRGSAPSENLRIVNNTIEDLQLEVNYARNVLIQKNLVSRAVKTAGIGIFSVGDNAIAEDYKIIDNSIMDPIGAGISVGIDPPTDRNCILRRITVTGNQIVRTKTRGFGIRIGTPDNSKRTSGHVFEDLVIKDNRIRVEATAPKPVQMIFANSSATAGIVFKRLTVSGNVIENYGPAAGEYAIDLKRIQNSLVADNTIKGATNGISLGGDLLANEVRNNVVEASDTAYGMEDSLGDNKAINNRVVGKSNMPWKLTGLRSSDVIER